MKLRRNVNIRQDNRSINFSRVLIRILFFVRLALMDYNAFLIKKEKNTDSIIIYNNP